MLVACILLVRSSANRHIERLFLIAKPSDPSYGALRRMDI
jgi:hypothetical protein